MMLTLSLMIDANEAARAAHLGSERISAFLDRTSSSSERRESARHLARCEECRRELAEARRILDSVPSVRGRRRRSSLAALLGIAATLAIMFLPRGDPAPESDATTRRRAPSAAVDAGIAITPVAPADDDTLNAMGVRLVWSPTFAVATYHVSVQDSAGTPIWSAFLPDTSIELPEHVRLVTGAYYFWSVDAQLPDGRSTSSGVRRFGIR